MFVIGLIIGGVFGSVVLGTVIATIAALLLLFLPLYWFITNPGKLFGDELIGTAWFIVALVIMGILLLPFIPGLIIVLLLIVLVKGVLEVLGECCRKYDLHTKRK